MRFGIFIPQGWRLDLVGIEPAQQWATMLGLAKHADDNVDWESIWVYDHFHTVPIPTGEATHEAWSLMAAYGAATTRVRLGQMCTCMAYRNPAYLAKVAATIDVISGGRVEMGIGAGWYEHEWRAFGYGFPGAGERLGMLRDGVEIFRQMWTKGIATHAGKHYTVDGAICQPRPLQGTSLPGSAANGIPMWVAGGGEKVTLKIAAQYADYTNFDGSPEGFAHKSELLKGHCDDLGRDYGEITRSANYNVIIGETEKEVAGRLDWIVEHYRKAGVPENVIEGQRKGMLSGPTVGTPEQIVEALKGMEAQGMTYAITNFTEAAYDTSGIELFEREVMPELRHPEPSHAKG
ncbi:LLM class F420-dependent oxidoreductase [Lapillicoccus sp.]|uniref:LLM class F420-dependent oxidoreductase n=1 Tax=Lapillicoccus sp. TaxID=1909287 RepID=UPI0025EAD758|nr:LLM class F420-dependent oxidoreductase [Lapillicoccus sp.]